MRSVPHLNHTRPRILIAGTGSGVGKTTISTGLMSALSRIGVKVQGFKVGPDYIDPSYHRLATRRPSRNLDSYMLSDGTILECFLKSTSDANISVIEGVMGFFDGKGSDETGSTAYVAKLLDCPVILVVDAWSASRSVAAIVLGFAKFDPGVRIAGVVLNRVAGEKHAALCEEAIKRATGIRVVGWIPNSQELAMPERHLGLVPSTEKKLDTARVVRKLARSIGSQINLHEVIEIAESARPITFGGIPARSKVIAGLRIGVAMDEAFSFYYPDALDALSENGAQVITFSPLHDASLPHSLSGLYIGGGFPEVFTKELEGNESMRRSVRDSIESGLPTLAECGGLMYLTKSMVDFSGESSAMVGVLEANTVMTRTLTLSYTLAEVKQNTILSKKGDSVKGHEFHYSRLESIPGDARFAYRMRMGSGIARRFDGWQVYRTLASYSHTHLRSNPRMASNFVNACIEYSRK